jgi:hypothetical protein
MRGKTDTVMVELCPYQDGAKTNDYQLKGVASMLHFLGGNYFNSYWSTKKMDNPVFFSVYLKFLDGNLRGLTHTGKIAVYYPVETVQAKYVPTNKLHWQVYRDNKTPIGGLEEDVRNLAKNIWAQNLDFDFIDAKALSDSAIEGSSLHIQGERFQTLLLVGVEYLELSTWSKIKAFENAGGKVYLLSGNGEIVVYSGKDVQKVKMPISGLDVAPLLDGVKNIIQFEKNPRLIYGEFLGDGVITGMFVNPTDIPQTVKFFGNGNLRIKTFETEELHTVDFEAVIPPKTAVFVEK